MFSMFLAMFLDRSVLSIQSGAEESESKLKRSQSSEWERQRERRRGGGANYGGHWVKRGRSMSSMINALYLRIRGMMVSRWGMTEGRIMRTMNRKVN